MSTKIYDAYKYDGDLSSLLSTFKDIKGKYLNSKIDMFSLFNKLEIKVEDGRKVLLKDLQQEILGEMFFGDFIKETIRKGLSDPMNIEASAVVYPYNNDLYVIFFGINHRTIKEYKDFKDFHYQNQSNMSNYDWDKEKWEEMTEERQKELDDDWDNRRKIWDEIMLDDDTFGEAGFTFDFHPSGYKLTMFCNEILEKIKERNEEKEKS